VHVRCATRKLAAILVSDVVGYSRLAGTDEDRILARLRGVRSDLIDPAIAARHGRVVKRTLWLKRHGLNISCGPRKLGRRMP
jgi:class 3 adenylate cyclase